MDNFRLISKLITVPLIIFMWGFLVIFLCAAIHTTCQGFSSYIAPLILIIVISSVLTYLLRRDLFSLKNSIQALEDKNFSYISDTFLINTIVISIIIGFLLYVFPLFYTEFINFGSLNYFTEFFGKIYKVCIFLPVSGFIIYMVAKIKKQAISIEFFKTSNIFVFITAVVFWLSMLALYLPICALGDCEV